VTPSLARGRSSRHDPLTMRSKRQPVATRGNAFRLFLRFLRPSDLRPLPPVATTGLDKGSILRCQTRRQRLRRRRRIPHRRRVRGRSPMRLGDSLASSSRQAGLSCFWIVAVAVPGDVLSRGDLDQGDCDPVHELVVVLGEGGADLGFELGERRRGLGHSAMMPTPAATRERVSPPHRRQGRRTSAEAPARRSFASRFGKYLPGLQDASDLPCLGRGRWYRRSPYSPPVAGIMSTTRARRANQRGIESRTNGQ
jgi:hypothetical protein